MKLLKVLVIINRECTGSVIKSGLVSTIIIYYWRADIIDLPD